MKRFMSLVALVAMPMFCAAFTANPDDKPVKIQVKPGTTTIGGRFQLFQGSYEHVGKGGASYIGPIIFKIDSTTGQVWQFFQSSSPENAFGTWMPINQ